MSAFPLFVCLLLVGVNRSQGSDFALFKEQRVHPTRILAKYRSGIAVDSVVRPLSADGLMVRERYSLVPGLVLFDSDARSLQSGRAPRSPADAGALLRKRISDLRKTGLFEYVEPDYVVAPDEVPTDGSFVDGTLWGLRNIGLSGGVIGADIGAEAAWDLTTGSEAVIVAVVDSGIRYTHQELAAQMWRNPGEVPGNGLDDDGDGYVDNVFGIDARTDTGDPFDYDGHGTHVAGILGAAANDGHPVVGVSWKVRLMACKFLDPGQDGLTSDAIRCIEFAVEHGARILNNSWGGGGFQQSLLQVLTEARNRGVLVVAAAGNESRNSDQIPHYPSSYPLDNILSVAAVDRHDQFPGFSNFGVGSVDLAAPGVEIYSTGAGSDTAYQLLSGTSMATPHVSGVAALLLAQDLHMSLIEMRQRILEGVVPMESLIGKTLTGGRLNAYRTLNAAPDGLLELTVSPAGGPLLRGSVEVVRVSVSDFEAVTDAVVVGSIPGLDPLEFRNDGTGPDVAAGDGVYSAEITVPDQGTTLVLTLDVSAPGKPSRSIQVEYELRAPPSNDAFSDATALTGTSATFLGSNWGATKEPGEPDHHGDPGGRSVWWRWTAPGNGVLSVETSGSDFDTVLAVYTGDTVDALEPVASDDDSGFGKSSLVTVSTIANTTYQVVVDGYDGAYGDVSLSFSFELTLDPPVNDDFANALLLSGSDHSVDGSNLGATVEVGEPNHAGVTGGASVWWHWVAPSAGIVRFKTIGSDFDTVVGVYVGESVDQLTEVASNNDFGQGETSSLAFLAGKRGHYFFVVDGLQGQVGTIAMSLVFEPDVPPPVNDLFRDRVLIEGVSGEVAGGNIGASKESGEPDHGGIPGGGSVWWTWVAPQDGYVSVSAPGDRFQTLFAIYQGGAIDALSVVASNVVDGVVQEGATWHAKAGEVFEIAVDGVSDTEGTITLRWEQTRTVEISGRVLYVSGVPAAAGVTLDLTGDEVLSASPDADGSYRFQVSPGGNYEVRVSFLEDGADRRGITALDMVAIWRHILAIQYLESPLQILAADLDGSGSVSSFDLQLLRRAILGVDDRLIPRRWIFLASELKTGAGTWEIAPDGGRSYTSLEAPALNQDYVGIKPGDANGSWTPE